MDNTQQGYESKYVDVLGSKMHYLEAGKGNPILFLHGIPASSYLWRNIMPHLATLGRCIAPDLIGYGRSGKPNIQYSVNDHINYIEQFIKALNLKSITVIMHGYGSIIGFDYAMKHEKNCAGLVFYEAFLRPLDLEDISLPYQEQLVTLREQEEMVEEVASGSLFIDRMLPMMVMRRLSEDEIKPYREPFLEAGSSKPIHQYIQELPTGDQKGVVDKIIAEYSSKLTMSNLPKLLLYSVPGFITTIASAIWAKEHLPNLEIVDIGEELHLAQESCPELIGESISVWLQGVEQAQV